MRSPVRFALTAKAKNVKADAHGADTFSDPDAAAPDAEGHAAKTSADPEKETEDA